MKAFRVTIYGQPGDEIIIAARTRGAARFLVWRSAHEAGFTQTKFGEFKVQRAPEHDEAALKCAEQTTLGYRIGVDTYGVIK